MAAPLAYRNTAASNANTLPDLPAEILLLIYELLAQDVVDWINTSRIHHYTTRGSSRGGLYPRELLEPGYENPMPRIWGTLAACKTSSRRILKHVYEHAVFQMDVQADLGALLRSRGFNTFANIQKLHLHIRNDDNLDDFADTSEEQDVDRWSMFDKMPNLKSLEISVAQFRGSVAVGQPVTQIHRDQIRVDSFLRWIISSAPRIVDISWPAPGHRIYPDGGESHMDVDVLRSWYARNAHYQDSLAD